MHKPKWAIGFAVLALAMTGLLTSCGGTLPLDVANLWGTWRLTGWSDSQGLPSKQITLVVDDTGAHGNSTCNAYQSTLTVDSTGTFRVGTLGTTYVLCQGATAEAETTYLHLLAAVTKWNTSTKDGPLVLSSNRNELLRFLRL